MHDLEKNEKKMEPMGKVKNVLTRSSDLSLYIRENDWYSFSGRGYLWKIGWKREIGISNQLVTLKHKKYDMITRV